MQKPKLFRKSNYAVKEKKQKNSWSVRKSQKLASVPNFCCDAQTNENSRNCRQFDNYSCDQSSQLPRNIKNNFRFDINSNCHLSEIDRQHLNVGSILAWKNFPESFLNDNQLQNSIALVVNRINYLLKSSTNGKIKRRKSLPSFSSEDEAIVLDSIENTTDSYVVAWNDITKSLKIELLSLDTVEQQPSGLHSTSFSASIACACHHRLLGGTRRALTRRHVSQRHLRNSGFYST